jgi:hypothetical protein
MFADYRVPQVLYHFGLIEYAESLKSHLRRFQRIKKNSEMETAIRGLSIYACEVSRTFLAFLNTIFLENCGGNREYK